VPHQWSRNGYASGKLELIPGFFCAVPVAQSLGFCVVFVVFVVLILLAIVLLDLRFTSSDYNFGVFKLFLFEID
jgi:hypothetical protein